MLQGEKILDFSTLLPGPYATMMFADLGAEVLRVESPTRVDAIRYLPPLIDGNSAAHKQLNRSKKSIALDLKQAEAVQIIHQLIGEYDIVIEQFRPGVMARFGLGYEQLKQINPKLIYCSITGYGQTGPLHDRAGHDINYMARSGLLGYSGRKSEAPSLSGLQIADIAGGSLHAVIGVLSAIIYRERTGIGQHIDVSMTDCTFSLQALYGSGYLANGTRPEQEELLLNGGHFYDYYETMDGRYFAVGSIEPQFRAQLCKAIGREDLLNRGLSDAAEDIQYFKQACREAFRSKTFAEWQAIFAQQDACVEPVLHFDEACEQEHVHERELIVEVPQKEGTTIKQLAHPIRFSDKKPTYNYAGGNVGDDTLDILIKFGYSQKDIESLMQKGAITYTSRR